MDAGERSDISAPALANAYFKLTRQPVRSLPFFPYAKMGGLCEAGNSFVRHLPGVLEGWTWRSAPSRPGSH